MTTLKIDDVIEVDEPNYQFGTGKLILRVTRVGDRTRAADGDWLDLDGFALRPDSTQISQQPRHVTVRIGAVRLRRG
jgi:hypothetical protein